MMVFWQKPKEFDLNLKNNNINVMASLTETVYRHIFDCY